MRMHSFIVIDMRALVLQQFGQNLGAMSRLTSFRNHKLDAEELIYVGFRH